MYKQNKYGNVKGTYDGITFDSRKEANRYAELKLLQRAGEIRDLERQKPYELIPAQYESYPRYGKDGKRLKDGERCVEKSCRYVADFVYTTRDGKVVVEDTKSEATRTKEYTIKRKLMLYVHGIRVREV